VVEVDRFDLEEIAFALSDQNVYDEHVHLVDPATGEIVLWTRDGGVDGKTLVDLDNLDLVAIDPLPSYVWYEDMAEFTELVSDDHAACRLARAINGRGSIRACSLDGIACAGNNAAARHGTGPGSARRL